MNILGISKQGYREIKNLGWDGFRFSGSIILLLKDLSRCFLVQLWEVRLVYKVVLLHAAVSVFCVS